MRTLALPIDTTRALRTHTELRELVEAVRDAVSGEPETDALEWKRSLDLASDADHRYNLARHVLGMGNRTSAVAQRSFEGCAYVLIGVEPGAVAGCPPWDPADIDNWLTRFVAPGAPRWHAAYIEVDQKPVLVVTVEPPRAGDGIFTLQRDHGSSRAGRIFVRRGGTTQEASPSEIRALEARLLGATTPVDVDVMAVGEPRVVAVRLDDAAAEAWIRGEVDRYTESLRRTRESRRRSLVPNVYGDMRSESAYVAEVNDYLEACGARFRALMHRRAIREDHGRLQLIVSNSTTGNFEGVQVSLTLSAGVEAFFDEDEPFELFEAPEPPDELGKGSLIAGVRPISFPVGETQERNTVERDGDRVVRFKSVHLRPGASERLAAVYLSTTPDRAGQDLEFRWRATSTSADKWSEGTLVVPVEAEPKHLSPVPGEVDDDS